MDLGRAEVRGGRAEVQARGTERMNAPRARVNVPRAHLCGIYPKPITNYAKAVGTSKVTKPHVMSPIGIKCVSNIHSCFNHLSKVIQ